MVRTVRAVRTLVCNFVYHPLHSLSPIGNWTDSAVSITVIWQWQQPVGLLFDTIILYNAGELAAVPLARLEAAVGEADAQWLSQLARGIDLEEVRGGPSARMREEGKRRRGTGGLCEETTANQGSCRRVGRIDLKLVVRPNLGRAKLHDEG